MEQILLITGDIITFEERDFTDGAQTCYIIRGKIHNPRLVSESEVVKAINIATDKIVARWKY